MIGKKIIDAKRDKRSHGGSQRFEVNVTPCYSHRWIRWCLNVAVTCIKCDYALERATVGRVIHSLRFQPR